MAHQTRRKLLIIFSWKFYQRCTLDKEASVTIWKPSIERRPCQAPAMLAPAQMITADHISTKILPEMYFGIKQSPSRFGSHPKTANLRQHPIAPVLATLHENNNYWSHPLENFTWYGIWKKKILKLSREHSPLPSVVFLGGGMHSPSTSSYYYYHYHYYYYYHYY